jgi:hypothetical protein
MGRARLTFAAVVGMSIAVTTAAAQPSCPTATASVDQITAVGSFAPGRVRADLGVLLAELEDVIDVHVVGLESLLAERDCRRMTQPNKALVLFLAGLPLVDRTGVLPSPPAAGIIRFQLLRTAANKDNWARIIGRPTLRPREVAVSVGFADQYPLASTAAAINILPRSELVLSVFFLLVIAVAFVICVRHSSILRDPAADGSGQPGAYSLAKTQAAWWFFTIFASYMLIAVVTGEFDSTLNGTALTLLGIGTATAIGSAVVQQSQAAGEVGLEQRSVAASIAANETTLRDSVTAARDRLASAGDVGKSTAAADLARAEATLARANALWRRLNNRSVDFLRDILSDANGVSFHHFQMAGWTLVLSFIFVKEVWEKLSMPDFDGNLLTLQGLSAATFIGLKMAQPAVPGAKA